MDTWLRRAIVAGMLSIFSTPIAYAGDITVDAPFARASAGAATVGAVFMNLKNSGATADALVAAESPVAARAELHTHIREGDIIRMRPVQAIDVPAGGAVSLQPGGLHVMLIDLRQPLKQGEVFPLTLTFAETGALTIQVSVQSPAGMAPMPAHKH